MTAEQYWHDDPYLAVSYRKAYELSLEAKNREAWWQGFYIYEASCAALAGIMKGKARYPKNPHEIGDKPVDVKEVRKKIKDSLTDLKLAWDRKYGRRESNP